MEVKQIQHLRSSLQLALTSAESIGVRDSKLPSEKEWQYQLPCPKQPDRNT
jgi:hypothetical protein